MRSVFITLTLLIGLFIFLTACGSSVTSAPASAPTSIQKEGMEHEEEPQGHGQEMHKAPHGGQVGMAMGAAAGGGDLHLEIVSDAPGQYWVYLSNENREPVSPEGYKGTLAVIKPDGSEIASMPLAVMEDYLQAQGGPTDVSQVDVRITLQGPGLSNPVEMDFTLPY